ncbi:hypothetical protein FQR65_LT19188 [Abscondita terminalis]|nr:hypothetical protein FQR65_LT19188 [Abscondita terminalis]
MQLRLRVGPTCKSFLNPYLESYSLQSYSGVLAQMNGSIRLNQVDALPQLIIDGQALEQNLQYATTKFKYATHLQPRLVVKSLACMELLKTVSAKLSTQRFMVFHLPQLLPILENFSEADVLLGKPMPVRLVQQFYTQHPQSEHAKYSGGGRYQGSVYYNNLRLRSFSNSASNSYRDTMWVCIVEV